MRITILSPHLPYSRIPHAGGQFSWQWLSALSHRCDIHLVVPATTQNTNAPRELPPNVEVSTVPVSRVDRSAAKLHYYAYGGVTPGLGILKGFRESPLLTEALASCDIVEIHWQFLIPLVDDIHARTAAPVTALIHDVVTQKNRRDASAASGAKRRLGSVALARRSRTVEARLMQRVDNIFTLSAKDADLLRALGVTRPIDVITPVLVVPAEVGTGGTELIVSFTGAMGRTANAESIRWFLDEVWPGVHRAVPGAKFVVAGADPPGWLLERRSPTVDVTGYVDDLGPVYRRSSVFVAPLRLGAGVKFKVLDAMAYGLPVVATTAGAEGIVEGAGTGCFAAITDDAERMAERVTFFLEHPDEARGIGHRARAWVKDWVDVDKSIGRAVDVYERLSLGAG